MIWAIVGGIITAVALSAWCLGIVLRGIFKILQADYDRLRDPLE